MTSEAPFDVQQWISHLHDRMRQGEAAVFAACFGTADENRMLRDAYAKMDEVEIRLHHPELDLLLLNQLLKSGIWTRERALAFLMHAEFGGVSVLGAFIRMDKCEASVSVIKRVEKMRGRAACSEWLGRPVLVCNSFSNRPYGNGEKMRVSLTPLCYAILLRRKNFIRQWLMMGLPCTSTSTVKDATVDAWGVSAAMDDGVFRYFHVAYKRSLNARRAALLLALILGRHKFPRVLVRHICEDYVWPSCCDECWKNR